MKWFRWGTAYLFGLSIVLSAFNAFAQADLQPIPGAGNWLLNDHLPPAEGCAADLHGENVDVHLLETKDGHMLLVAGRPDWKFNPGPASFRLQIDAGPDAPANGDAVANLLLTPVDDALQTRLFAANMVTWRLPSGEYRAGVAGLKAAFAALKACDIRKGVKR
jgi:hypothetical protein